MGRKKPAPDEEPEMASETEPFSFRDSEKLMALFNDLYFDVAGD